MVKMPVIEANCTSEHSILFHISSNTLHAGIKIPYGFFLL